MIAELALAAWLAFGGGLETVRALAVQRPVPNGPTVLERLALGARAEQGLEQLRAGAPALPAAPAADERAALDDAQRDAQDLEQQRGGELDLSDRELAIIAITAGAVLLLVLLL